MSERSRVAAEARGNEEAGEGSNKPDSKKRKNKKMKKVMMLAAIAALAGGAFAQAPCVIGPTPVTTNASVYAWKFTGKTTVGTLLTQRVINLGSNCSLGAGSSNIVCAIRIPGTLAIQGYTYYCDNCCDSFASGTAGSSPTKFYMTRPFQDVLAANLSLDVAHIIGTRATQYEAEGVAVFDSTEPAEKWTLTFAGFGSFNTTLKVPTVISGNFAGKLESPYYVARGVCSPADYWDCATLLPAGKASDPGIAYGTWSVRYNAAASRVFRARGTRIAVPAWAGGSNY